MSDELDRMKRAFERQEPIRPRDDARKAAIDAALQRFAVENESVRQGVADEDRQRERGSNKPEAFNWRRLMILPHMTTTRVLAGSASLAVLAIALVSFNQVQPNLIPPLAQDSAEEEAAPVAQTAEQDAYKPEVLLEAFSKKAAPERIVAQATPPPAESRSRAQGLSDSRVENQSLAAGAVASAPLADAPAPGFYQDQGRDKFTDIDPNGVKLVTEEPVSTFSVDVDTASYAFMRGALNRGVLPQTDAVRVEELINYFDYDYAVPQDRTAPFAAQVSVMPTPWNDSSKLLQIGIKGYELPQTEAPPANLVFLIDTSGSMSAPDKLPLLRNAFRLLVSSLKPDDTVSIVAYAGSAGTVLEPTKVADKDKILAALDQMQAGGSTAGAEGIRLAYQLAEANKADDAVNRVILATDGDFNVGITDTEELKDFIERKRDGGISLSVLGFGRGNYNDELMQTLAQNGNGNAAYVDTLNEARKVLVEEAGSTLFTIAKDVKLQLEFNPATVSEYRLIGYETRLLDREDFNNDKVDAGDIGTGHTVTALYEFTPVGSPGRLVDDLRYKKAETTTADGNTDEYAFLKIRYKLPESDTSQLITVPVTRADETTSVASAPEDFRFAAAVAGFGQLLTGGEYTGGYSYDDVIAMAQASKGDDPFGYRSEFVNLARLAKSAAALEPLKQ